MNKYINNFTEFIEDIGGPENFTMLVVFIFWLIYIFTKGGGFGVLGL